MKRKKSAPIWEQAKKLTVRRTEPMGGREMELEPGVKFFIRALEHLGARTYFSCEGHPNGFYILFSAPADLAVKVAGAGYFGVQIIDNWINQYLPAGIHTWSVNLRDTAAESLDKNETLTSAAQAWADKLRLPTCVWRGGESSATKGSMPGGRN